MAARTMALEECIRHDGLKMWMELREMPGQTVPVVFYSERIPYLRFDAQDRVLMISVRADYYGMTWRCWDMEPGKTDWVQDREEKYQEILDSVDAGKKAWKTDPADNIQVMTREEHADLHSAGRKGTAWTVPAVPAERTKPSPGSRAGKKKGKKVAE